MNNASKVSILAALTLLTGGAAVSAGLSACTTTVSIGPADDADVDSYVAPVDGDFPDTYVAPVDGGADSGLACQAQCPILTQVTFETVNPPCSACDTCVAAHCCTTATSCFSPQSTCPAGGANTCACENDCVQQCDATDGGDTCLQGCQLAYQDDSGMSVDMTWQAMSTCIMTNCSSVCQ